MSNVYQDLAKRFEGYNKVPVYDWFNADPHRPKVRPVASETNGIQWGSWHCDYLQQHLTGPTYTIRMLDASR